MLVGRVTGWMGFPCGSAGKESACNAGGLCLIPGLGRSPGEGSSYPLQYSGLENSMNCIVHGGQEGSTGLSDFHFHLPDKIGSREELSTSLPLCGLPPMLPTGRT